MAGTNLTSVRSYILYAEGLTPNSNTFASASFPFVDLRDSRAFTSQAIVIANDNASPGASIQFSFDGVGVHGTILAGEKFIMDFMRMQQIYLRSSSASAYRLWVW